MSSEDDNKAKELYDKRILLTGLCKLIAFQIFDVKLAAPIYTQFLKVGKSWVIADELFECV